MEAKTTNKERIINSMNELNSVYGNRSYESIDKLKESGKLKEIIEKNNGDYGFRNLLINFFERMGEPSMVDYPYSKKIILYNFNDLLEVYRLYAYELGKLFDCDDAIVSFPSFMVAACKYYGFHPFAEFSVKEMDKLLTDFIDMKHEINLNPRVGREDKGMTIHRGTEVINAGEWEALPVMHYHVDSSKYDEYEKHTLTDPSQKLGVEAEAISLSCFKKGDTLWVSRQFGDGYGFDILNLNKTFGHKKETLIEVKARFNSEDFTLSRVEHKVMVESDPLKHTDYFIHKYNMGSDGRFISFRMYKYDKENNVLYDVNNPYNICRILPEFENGDMSKPVFKCVHERTYVKIKSKGKRLDF